MQSVAFLESVLRAHKLDHTVAPGPRAMLSEPSETGIPPLDAQLRGGLPRGELSQIVGPRSSGRTTLMAVVLASATGRGEVVALVDALDRFDPASGAAAGIDLSHLLWIRGRACGPREMHTPVERAVKAMGLVLNAGNFGCAVLDLADVPTGAIRRLPFTTWLRLGRALEGSRTVGLVVGSDPIARSAGGRTIALRPLDAVGRWTGASDRDRLFQGLDLEARVITKEAGGRRQEAEEIRLHIRVPDSSSCLLSSVS